MKEVELEPHEYHCVGSRRLPNLDKRQKLLLWGATACGIWAACALQLTRAGIVTFSGSVPMAFLFVFGPGFILWFVHWLLIDRHTGQ